MQAALFSCWQSICSTTVPQSFVKKDQVQTEKSLQLFNLPYELTLYIGSLSENPKLLETCTFFYKQRAEIVRPLFEEVLESYTKAQIFPEKIKEKYEKRTGTIDYYNLLKELFFQLKREYGLKVCDVNFMASSFWKELKSKILAIKDNDLLAFWQVMIPMLPCFEEYENAHDIRKCLSEYPFPLDFLCNVKLTVVTVCINNDRTHNIHILRLPDEIKYFERLECLVFNGIGIYSVSSSIVALKSLSYLDLSYNNLSEFPECITEILPLKKLELAGNEIKSIPESISKLCNLEILDLSYNDLTELPDSLSLLTNLKELNLLGNNIKKIPDSVNNIRGLIIKVNSLDRG